MRHITLAVLLVVVLVPHAARATLVELSDGIDTVVVSNPPPTKGEPNFIALPPRVGAFTIQTCDGCEGPARAEFVTRSLGRLNKLTLTDALFTNTGSELATLLISFTESHDVNTAVPRFYGLSLSGFFGRLDPFFGDSLALGDVIALEGSVFYTVGSSPLEAVIGLTRYEVIGEDPFNTLPNSFAPQDPPQTIDSFTCGPLCDSTESLLGLLRITLGGGDSLALPGSAAIVAAATEELLNEELAREAAAVPWPWGLVLVGLGAAALPLRHRRRDRD